MKPLPTLALLLACASTALAQQPAPPAKELAKLDRLIGSWEGSGFVVHAYGGDRSPWTCTATTRKVMGGHFLREDTAIHVGEGQPPLCFTSFFGWDNENSRYIALAVSNMGEASTSELMFKDDDTLVQFNKSFPEGKLGAERWRTKLGDDEYSFVGESATMDGRPFVHVRGRMKRAKAAEASTAPAPGAFIGVEANDHMKRLAKMAGEYDIKGSMRMNAEAAPFPISGIEQIHPIFDGTVLELTTVGQPDYEAWAAMAWDAHENAYRLIYVNNHGQSGTMLSHWVGNDLVTTQAGLMMGVTTASRTIMPCNSDGHLTGATSHSLAGSDAPLEVMTLTYTRK